MKCQVKSLLHLLYSTKQTAGPEVGSHDFCFEGYQLDLRPQILCHQPVPQISRLIILSNKTWEL